MPEESKKKKNDEEEVDVRQSPHSPKGHQHNPEDDIKDCRRIWLYKGVNSIHFMNLAIISVLDPRKL